MIFFILSEQQKTSFEILHQNLKTARWHGACLDTGAQSTVIGLRQAHAYCKFMGTKFKPTPSARRFKFGRDEQTSLGRIAIRIPIHGWNILIEHVDIVRADVPFLIGLDLLDKYKMYLNNVSNQLCFPQLDITVPVIRKFGHIYLEWAPHERILYTKSELTKLHRAFSHPTNDNLLNLLKLARPAEANSDAAVMLEEIRKSCDTCQRLGTAPMRFKVSLPDENELKYGEEISMDLMFIDNQAILHIVDTATRFSAACYLDSNGAEYGQSLEGIWLAFVNIWCTVYIGLPNRLRADHGSVFVADRWRQLCTQSGVKVRISGAQAHSSLGIGERLHGPLRRIFNKVIKDHPAVPRRVLLNLAVKAMNDTIGENGLVPSRLVFGMIPRFPIISYDIPSQKDRMDALATLQKEMNAIIAERRVLTALNRDIPPAADRVYSLGEKVLVYSEKEKEWVGTYTVVHINGRMITVQNDTKKTRHLYNAFQLKPYYPPDTSETDEHGTSPSPPDNEQNSAVENAALAEISYILYCKLQRFKARPKHVDCWLTEIIEKGDPRQKFFAEPKQIELQGLIDRDTWEIVSRSKIPKGANVMGARFVLTIKDEGTENERWKARLVVQGFNDNMKSCIVHDIPILRHFSVKIIVAVAALMGFRLFSTDVTQAYLQSTEEFTPEKAIVRLD